MFSAFNHKRSKSQSGISLVEIMVVISIFLIITGVVFANLPDFRDKSFLQLVAQEIAITIRQAQVFGVGTRGAGTDLYPSHGIHFDFSGGNKTMILFADEDNDQVYDPGDDCGGSTTECVEKFAINGAASFDTISSPENDCDGVERLDIVFRRPYPDAGFYDSAELSCSRVVVTVISTKDPTRSKEIEVWNTGQISVKDS